MARMSGPIQGVLPSYETFTAFFLEASFFGIFLFGRPRVPPVREFAYHLIPYLSAFMFWGEGLFVFPLMLIYTVVSYSIFRGKTGLTSQHY
jgi:hypothetical protein